MDIIKKILPLAFLAVLLLMACGKKDNNEVQPTFSKDKIEGVTQKGPFLNGSSLTAYELDDVFAQTGKSFNTQIKDNLGSFELDNINLATQYVKLKADGFYFNEITNSNSAASITLYALSDLSDKSIVNVNMLTNMEVSRVEYLLDNGYTFVDAKKQAQKEVLDIFSLKKPDMAESELLDISKSSEDDAILLAISLILQGYRSEADLTELMGDINTDIRSDGILSSSSTGSKLVNDAHLLDLEQIRSNLANKFADLGINDTIPDFEKYIHVFLDSTKYVITNAIVYPEFSNYGENILFDDKDTFRMNQTYSMAANLPAGTSIKLIIKDSYPNWGIDMMPDGPINWTVHTFDDVNHQQIINSTENGVNCDLIFMFMDQGPLTPTLEYYENGSSTPSKIKKLYAY